MPTLGLTKSIEQARWEAPADVQATLEREVALLAANEPHSFLRETYASPYRNERNRIVELHVHERILAGKVLKKNEVGFFKADMPDTGVCRFYMRIADSHGAMHEAPEAMVEHNLNLLRSHDEWVVPPSPDAHRPGANLTGKAATTGDRADQKPVQTQSARPKPIRK